MSSDKKVALLSIDQGTTSSRAIVFSVDGSIISTAQFEFTQFYPNDGWVEHDPEEIWNTSLRAAQIAFREAEGKGYHVAAIGITNQRETSIIWDRATNAPLYNAIVWQDRRTADVCEKLKADGREATVQSKTGLLLDPYFSATKAAWILDHVQGARDRAAQGALAFGTVDSFLIWRLTGGKVHATDSTNASRTNLFNIHSLKWDPELLKLFNVPQEILPQVKDSADDYGLTDPALFGRKIPIYGVAGDQQAAAFGQCCFQAGDIKSTYGTGCFVLLNTGHKTIPSNNRLLTTVAYTLDGKPTYALEGSIFIAGAAVQWLRDALQIIKDAKETEAIAANASGNEGVYLVPAFTGLGSPYWNPNVRAAIFGMTRATGRNELVRATLESIAYQTSDLFTAMAKDGIKPLSLKVDGGMVANKWFMQFLSNVLDMTIQRPAVMETTALGVAYLAGLKAGIYADLETIADHWQVDHTCNTDVDFSDRDQLLAQWHKAVKCAQAYSA